MTPRAIILTCLAALLIGVLHHHLQSKPTIERTK